MAKKYQITTDDGKQYEITTDEGDSDPLTGQSLPSVPTPKPPAGLATDAPASYNVPQMVQHVLGRPPAPLDPYAAPKDENIISAGVRRVLQTPFRGPSEMGQGVVHMSEPGLPAKVGGASQVFRGGLDTASPFMVQSAITAPIRTGLGMLYGFGGQQATEAGLNMLGVNPEYSAAAGDAVGTATGMYGAGPAARRVTDWFKPDIYNAVTRAARPTPSNEDFNDNLPQTLAAVKATNPGFKPIVEKGKLNVGGAIDKTIGAYQDALEPWLQRMEGTNVDTSPIIAATQRAISDMPPSEQAGGHALVDRARQDFGRMDPRALRQRLALMNQRLSAFYNASGERQSSALADIPEAVFKAQRDAVADTLYKHLDPENQGNGPRLLQSRTSDLIDLRDALARRNNAIVAEQPITKAGAVFDTVKGALHKASPLGHRAGTGIAYSEGSQGRSLPLLRQAFNAADEAVGANEFNNLPRPGPRMIGPPADTSGSLPPGVAGFRSVGSPYAVTGPKLLPPASSPIGVSGTVVPNVGGTPKYGYNPNNDPLSTPTSQPSQLPPRGLLPAPAPGSPSQNVELGGTATGPGGPDLSHATQNPIPLPGQRGGRMADLARTPTQTLTLDDVRNYAARKGVSITQAAKDLDFVIPINGYARGGIIGKLPPRLRTRFQTSCTK